MQPVVILSATRTPIGAYLGGLKDVPSPELGAIAIREAVARAGVPADLVEECLMGCVLQAGLGQAPARQAALKGGLPESVRCTTIHRVCGSGLKAVMLGAQMIQAGDCEVVVCGGMENMSRAPYLLDRAREGYRLGHGALVDSVIKDGLWDVYNEQHMGQCAELCAREKGFSRQEQDRFARQSYERALHALESKAFAAETVAVNFAAGKKQIVLAEDEEPKRAKLEKFGELKPAFDPNGSVTAANASSLSDGASALVLCSERFAAQRALKPLGKLLAQASHAQAPQWFTTAPVGALQKLAQKSSTDLKSIDLFEINEAFSVVALACMQGLSIDEAKTNIRGGAVALGHPIGASGARILTTLLHALRAEGLRRGAATICIGGGEASAVLVEAMPA